ncbi:hypothetical protein D621_21210 [beta proteobacterium AAP51]|nr:hypothetical protein D621_21210 [beta proteobacterium AAP51]
MQHRTRLAAMTAIAALSCLGASAQAQMLVGITSANEIARFDAATPGMAMRTAITGLDAGDRFVGIDLRPSNNTLYGLTLSNRLYTLNESTGVATFVAALSSPVVNGAQGWGLDFNPVADYSGATSLRVVGTMGGNFAVNAVTGAVTTATPIAAGYSGVAYTNSTPAGAPASTGLFYINGATDTLAFAATGFNNPSITTVGSLGLDVLNANGFEILANGMAYAALNRDGGTLGTGLYAINLMTGAATMVGEFNGTLTGLSVSAVPEPATWALMLAGVGVAVGAAKRRRQG